MEGYCFGGIVSKILEQQVVDEKGAVDEEALFLLIAIFGQLDAVFIIFRRVLGTSVPEMHDFPRFFSFYQVVNLPNVVLNLVQLRGNRVYF